MITLTKYGNLPNMETITDVINITKYRNDHRNQRDQHYQIWLCLNMETDLRQLPNMVIPNMEISIYGNFLQYLIIEQDSKKLEEVEEF